MGGWKFTSLGVVTGGFSLRKRNQRRGFGKGVKCSVQQPPPPAWPGRAVPELPRQSWDGPKPISIVGSTGSIGTQALCFIYHFSSIAWIKALFCSYWVWPDSRLCLRWLGIYIFFMPPRYTSLWWYWISCFFESFSWIRTYRLLFFFVYMQTLDIVAENPDKFRVVALAAGSNVTLLADQVHKHHASVYK